MQIYELALDSHSMRNFDDDGDDQDVGTDPN